MLYPNFEAELVRKNLSRKDVANVLGINICTVTPKLKEPKRIKYHEVVAIRNNLFPDLTIDYLFQTN